MKAQTYLMENEDECLRMDIKTDYSSLESQALWAGLKEGMRVADIGCGSGITSSFLKQIVGESGHVTGIDGSMERIVYARENYGVEGLEFLNLNINNSLDGLKDYGRAKKVQLASLVDRGHRELPIHPDFVGKVIPTARKEIVKVEVFEIDGVDRVVIR